MCPGPQNTAASTIVVTASAPAAAATSFQRTGLPPRARATRPSTIAARRHSPPNHSPSVAYTLNGCITATSSSRPTGLASGVSSGSTDGDLSYTLPGGVDVRADAGVDRAHQIEPRLDRAIDGERQMLVRLRGAAEPGVIGDVDEDVRIALDEPPRERGKDVLVADHRPQAHEAGVGSAAERR